MQREVLDVTGFFLFHAMLWTLRPLLSSQLNVQRRSRAGGGGLWGPSSLGSTSPSAPDIVQTQKHFTSIVIHTDRSMTSALDLSSSSSSGLFRGPGATAWDSL